MAWHIIDEPARIGLRPSPGTRWRMDTDPASALGYIERQRELKAEIAPSRSTWRPMPAGLQELGLRRPDITYQNYTIMVKRFDYNKR